MKNEFNQEDMKVKNEIRLGIEGMKNRYLDVQSALTAFNFMADDIKSGQMIDMETSIKHMGCAEEFILSTQTLETIRDKIKGEFKHYILGEYGKKDKEPVKIAINESHKIHGLLEKANFDTSYRMLLFIGEAKQAGLTVWDREIRTGHVVSYPDAIKIFRIIDKKEIFKGINTSDDEYVRIAMRREENGYELRFMISSCIENKKGKSLISLKREIKQFMFALLGEERGYEVTDTGFNHIIVTIDSHDYEFLVSEGIEDSLSKKKLKKINHLLGRHNTVNQEDSVEV